MDGTFKGVTLSTKGIIIQSIDWFKKPQRRSEQTLIDGKDGATVTEFGYAPYIIPATIGLTDMTKLDEVIALLDGSGVLTFSGDPLKYRNARVLEQIDYQKLLKFRVADVQFFIENPYRYLLTESVQSITTFPGTIVNSGTAIAKPLLKVYGTGTIDMTLNGVNFSYVFDTNTYVHIDCDTMDAYYGSFSKNRSLTIVGDVFPTLSPGNNTLTINSGTVTKVEVTKRSRYL